MVFICESACDKPVIDMVASTVTDAETAVLLTAQCSRAAKGVTFTFTSLKRTFGRILAAKRQ